MKTNTLFVWKTKPSKKEQAGARATRNEEEENEAGV
jgi:hypothetical protein